MTGTRRKTRRAKVATLREQAAAAANDKTRSKEGEKCAFDEDFIPTLTRKRMAFAMHWAEADPEDSMGDIARRAGYSESVATSGKLTDICRDEHVLKLRDRRLAELQKVSGVTAEDSLIGLRALAMDPMTPARDRVAARKTILAWYSATKGMHKPEVPADTGPAKAGTPDEWADQFELDVLNIRLNGPDDG